MWGTLFFIRLIFLFKDKQYPMHQQPSTSSKTTQTASTEPSACPGSYSSVEAASCHLNDDNHQCLGRFVERQAVNHNCYRFKFALPNPHKRIGVKIGQFLRIGLKGSQRPYCAVSRIESQGQVELVVRDMRAENGEKSFTNGLMQLKEGDEVTIMGPFTQYLYHGNGLLEWPDQPMRQFRRVGIIAYESAINGVYQFIEELMRHEKDPTAVDLLWMGSCPEDFYFDSDLKTMSHQHPQKLRFSKMLYEAREGWQGPVGKVTTDILTKHMPPPGDDTCIILISGPDEFESIGALMRDMHYSHFVPPVLA